MTTEGVQRRLTAILAADVAGYSRLVGADEEGTLAQWKAHWQALIQPKVTEHHGRVVRVTGDGILVEFFSAVEALRCAIQLQQGMAERNIGLPEEKRIEFRIGINVGDVIVNDGDFWGESVNIAARLEALSNPGAICISARVRDDVEGKLDISFDDLGEKRLKNIARPVHLYRVRVGGLARRPMPPVPEKPSIAVLPFHTPGGDSDQDTFADGMLEEIVTALARTKWLFVISVNSSASYKGRRNIDDREVGRELGVRYVLEGSVRKSANRVRVAAQLVDAIGGHHVWAERYESVQAEIFAMQDEITDRVVAAIEPRLYAAEGIRARRKPPESLDAWESVVRSISLINARTKPDADMARQLLQTAIELDPGYAQAHSLMAFVLAFGVHSGWYPREDALAAAHDNARRALRLDPLEPWAHAACGFAFVLSRRIAEGVLEYERAIDLNPSFAQGYTMLSAALCYLGRGQDAMARLDTAERLSPLDLLTHGNLGSINVMRAAACMVDNRFQEGSVFARRAIVENPSSTPAARELVINLALAGELDEAKSALNIVKRLQPDITLKWIEDWSPFVRDEDTLKYIDGFRLVGLE